MIKFLPCAFLIIFLAVVCFAIVAEAGKKDGICDYGYIGEEDGK